MTGARNGWTYTSSRKAVPGGRAKKRFGQHFLSDLNILNRIVDAAEITPEKTALEVGPGLGSLTSLLAEQASRIVAVEIDRDLVPVLRERFAAHENVAVVEADVLESTPRELLEKGQGRDPYVVVANLPYNIGAAVVRHFLEGDARPLRMVVMVQLEVAESLASSPPRMTLLGVATQIYADVRMVMKVPPGAFSPPPKVQSGVVRIDVLPSPRVDVPLDQFFKIVRAGFGNPRKQLRNSLSFGLHVKQEVVDEVMHDAGADPTLRPHVLSIDDWADITRAWIERTRR